MSQWTHVAGVIRVDGIGPIMGLTKEDEVQMLAEAMESSSVPCGSEGPIGYHIQHNDKGNSSVRAIIAIWGDLRDFDDVGGIALWFISLMKKFDSSEPSPNFPFWARDGVITIDKEFAKSRLVCSWNGEDITQTKIKNKGD